MSPTPAGAAGVVRVEIQVVGAAAAQRTLHLCFLDRAWPRQKPRIVQRAVDGHQLEVPAPLGKRGIQNVDLRQDLAVGNIPLRAVMDDMNVDVDVTTHGRRFKSERRTHLDVSSNDVVDSAALDCVRLDGHAPDTELILRECGAAEGKPCADAGEQTRPAHRTPP